MVGRDIGTVVLPSANVKIFLDASIKERAERRFIEEESRGARVSFEEILENIKHRDQIDTTRSIAPLVPAETAITIQTDGKTIDEVVSLIIERIIKE